jgi:L-threonylcarbamoyladenylate synthase
MKIIRQKDIKVSELVRMLKEGKVVVLPTDTVYGLVADATNRVAVNKIFKIKKRNIKSAVPIFVKDLKAARRIAKAGRRQEKILETIWPGRVTTVLERKKARLYGIKEKTIALRIPKYKLLKELLGKTKRPLTGTSANISGEAPTTKVKKMIKSFKNKKHQPDLIVDAGSLPENKPSTVLDLTVWPPKVLRK